MSIASDVVQEDDVVQKVHDEEMTTVPLPETPLFEESKNFSQRLENNDRRGRSADFGNADRTKRRAADASSHTSRHRWWNRLAQRVVVRFTSKVK